jgi:hypothetical protein
MKTEQRGEGWAGMKCDVSYAWLSFMYGEFRVLRVSFA